MQNHRRRGVFYDTRGLLPHIRSTYNSVIRTTEMDIIRPVMEAELLVLDDLGAERPTDWVEETMNVIVNSRYNAKLPDDLHFELRGHSRSTTKT